MASTSIMTFKNPGDYYLAITALTPKEVVVTEEQTVSTYDLPASQRIIMDLIPLPFLLFGIVFICVFGFQIIHSAISIRRTVIAVVLALFAAGIPFMMKSLEQGTHQLPKAGPDEIPRNVRVVADVYTSVTIAWNTETPQIGAVRMGTAPFSLSNTFTVNGDEGKAVMKHTVRVDRLEKGKTYEFEVLSGNRWYDDSGKYLQFMVK